MMIDFGEDGEPEANTHFATDAHSAAAYTFELPGGGTIEAKQASAKEGLGTGACLLYTSPSPRDKRQSRMPSSA